MIKSHNVNCESMVDTWLIQLSLGLGIVRYILTN